MSVRIMFSRALYILPSLLVFVSELHAVSCQETRNFPKTSVSASEKSWEGDHCGSYIDREVGIFKSLAKFFKFSNRLGIEVSVQVIPLPLMFINGLQTVPCPQNRKRLQKLEENNNLSVTDSLTKILYEY